LPGGYSARHHQRGARGAGRQQRLRPTPQDVERPRQAGRHHRGEPVRGDVLRGGEERPARGVDQQRDGAVRFGRGERRLHLLRVTDVGDVRNDAGVAGQLHRLLETVEPARDYVYFHPCPGQRERDVAADAAGGTGHQRAVGNRGVRRWEVVHHADQPSLSMMVALAMPPPSHMVWSPNRPPVRSRTFRSVAISFAPEAPSGWPLAIAPPWTLTFDMSAPVSFSQASSTGANASFTSKASMSAMVMPARSRIRWVAGMTPVSMRTGSSPTTAKCRMAARGVRPSCRARSADMMSTAAAPSEICDALPAVTTHGSSG